MNKLTKLILLALLITLSVAWAIALMHTGRLLESHSVSIIWYGMKAGFFGLLAAIFIAQYSELQKIFDDVINKDRDAEEHFGTIDIFMILSLGSGMVAAIILFIGVIIGNASGNYTFLSGLVWFSKTPLTVLIAIGILVNLLYFVVMMAGGFFVGMTHSVTKSAAGFGILALIVIVYLLYTSDMVKFPKTSDPLAKKEQVTDLISQEPEKNATSDDLSPEDVAKLEKMASGPYAKELRRVIVAVEATDLNARQKKRLEQMKKIFNMPPKSTADNGANVDQGDPPVDQKIVTGKGKIISNKVASNGKVTQIIAPQPD